MRDADGNISMWIASNTDIHEQKEKEEALRRLNDDLQQFAYSASHDLQEPIRNVAVYSEIVADAYDASSWTQRGGSFSASWSKAAAAWRRSSTICWPIRGRAWSKPPYTRRFRGRLAAYSRQPGGSHSRKRRAT